MPAPEVSQITASVEQVQLIGLDVLNWRYECLELAGYPTLTAIELSARADVDLHEACALLHNGATVAQAVAILT